MWSEFCSIASCVTAAAFILVSVRARSPPNWVPPARLPEKRHRNKTSHTASPKATQRDAENCAPSPFEVDLTKCSGVSYEKRMKYMVLPTRQVKVTVVRQLWDAKSGMDPGKLQFMMALLPLTRS